MQTKSKHTFYVQKIFFFWKHCSLLHNAENYSIVGEATDDSKIWSVLVACRITKATHTYTHSEYIIFNVSPRQHLLRKRYETKCYVIHTAPVFFTLLLCIRGLRLVVCVVGRFTQRCNISVTLCVSGGRIQNEEGKLDAISENRSHIGPNSIILLMLYHIGTLEIQGGSNMTGTICV